MFLRSEASARKILGRKIPRLRMFLFVETNRARLDDGVDAARARESSREHRAFARRLEAEHALRAGVGGEDGERGAVARVHARGREQVRPEIVQRLTNGDAPRLAKRRRVPTRHRRAVPRNRGGGTVRNGSVRDGVVVRGRREAVRVRTRTRRRKSRRRRRRVVEVLGARGDAKPNAVVVPGDGNRERDGVSRDSNRRGEDREASRRRTSRRRRRGVRRFRRFRRFRRVAGPPVRHGDRLHHRPVVRLLTRADRHRLAALPFVSEDDRHVRARLQGARRREVREIDPKRLEGFGHGDEVDFPAVGDRRSERLAGPDGVRGVGGVAEGSESDGIAEVCGGDHLRADDGGGWDARVPGREERRGGAAEVGEGARVEEFRLEGLGEDEVRAGVGDVEDRAEDGRVRANAPRVESVGARVGDARVEDVESVGGDVVGERHRRGEICGGWREGDDALRARARRDDAEEADAAAHVEDEVGVARVRLHGEAIRRAARLVAQRDRAHPRGGQRFGGSLVVVRASRPERVERHRARLLARDAGKCARVVGVGVGVVRRRARHLHEAARDHGACARARQI